MPMRLIDTHCHINFNAFKKDSDEVIKRALDKNIWMIAVGSQFSTSARAVEYTQKYPTGVFAAIGLHPIQLEEIEIIEDDVKFISRAEKFNKSSYRQLAKKNKVVAIGETGLDFYYIDKNNKEKTQKQKNTFIEHIGLAEELNLPLIIHCRASKDDPEDAYEAMLQILEKYKNKIHGVIHCFGGTIKQAKKFIDLGFYIGFTGIITFDKSGKYKEMIISLQLNKLLVETDAPYLTPQPHRGKRNEPAFVEFVAQKIAQIKNIPFEKVAQITTQNAKNLFKLT